MAVIAVEYKKKRSGTTYNPKKNCYIGYRIDVRINNVRYRNKRFSTRKQAEDYIDQLKLKKTYAKNGVTYKAPTEIPRISEVFAKRLNLITNHSEKVRATRVFKLFEELVGFDARITDIKTAHFQIFNNRRIEDGVKKETVNREINTLSPAFKSAVQMFPEQLEDYQPPLIPRLGVKRHKGRTRVVTELEKNQICDYLRKPQKEGETAKVYENRIRIGRMFEIAWLLGLRFGEVSKLKKKDFNFDERTLKVIRWKTGALTIFEFLPEFLCHKIKQAAEASESEYIYTISGNYPKNFYSILKDAVESNGLVYGREYLDGITFHSNRHSFTTRLIQKTDLATAQSFTGLSTKDLLGYYGHATDESRRMAMENLYTENREFGVAELREIFEQVQRKEFTFEDFYEIVAGVKTETVGNNRTQKLRLVK